MAPVNVSTFRELWATYGRWAEVHLPKTWGPVRYAHGKRLVGFFGDMPWTSVTHAKLDEYVTWRRKHTTIRKGPPENATINNEIVSARACLAFCLSGAPEGQNPISGQNPADGYPKLPLVDVRDFSIAEDDFVRLLEKARPILRLIMILALETGMRRDEFRLLRWDEIDDRRLVVKLPAHRTKSGKAREIPLSDTAIAVLKAVPRYSGSQWVFEGPQQNNQPIAKGTLRLWFVKARRAAGIKGPRGQEVWIHSIRKTFGTMKAMQGMPIYMLMDIMGHSSPAVHFSYVKMSPAYHGQARELLNGRKGPQASLPANESVGEPTKEGTLLRFISPAVADTRKTCSACGELGHNARSCGGAR